MGKKRVSEAVAVLEPREDDETESEVPPGQLGDWQAVLPKEVREAADVYIQSLRENNSAREAMNQAKEECINMMVAHEIERVRIDEGGKYLVCEQVMKLKTEKPKGQEDERE